MMKTKICILCGKEFQSKQNARRICYDKHYRKCKYCGEEFEIHRPSDSQQCCSKECTQKLRESTMIKHFGVPYTSQSAELLEKVKRTNIKRFGTPYPAQSQEIKNKQSEICLEKYGVTTPFLMDDFQSKSMKTCRENYGVSHTSQIPGRTEKMQQTNLERYGSLSPMGNSDIQKAFSNRMLKEYGVPFYCMTDNCRSKQHNIISKYNVSFCNMLSSVGLTSEFEFHLDKYSYDLHIVCTNTLIEIDPTYTHNAVGNHWSTEGTPKNYHIEKSKVAESNGYKCVHVFDWDNIDKVIHMLSPCETLYARKCEVIQIDVNTVNQFEGIYHLQGKCNGQKVCYGLYYKGDLLEVMTFGKPRYNKKYQWEMLRLCTKTGYKIIGGASKLFKHFLSDYSPVSVISYCDRSKFNGRVYENIGMALHHTTDPAKIWSKGSDRITNNLLLQRGYDQLFKANYGKGTSNEELMLNDGWLPVYDCGQDVYDWRLLN